MLTTPTPQNGRSRPEEAAAGESRRPEEIPPTTNPSDEDARPTLPPPTTSLDHSETTVKANIQASSERDDIGLDTASLPARFRHSGWCVQRKRVFEALKSSGQPVGRLKAFATCGSFGWLQRSNVMEPTPTGPRYRYRIACHHCKDRLCTPCANARSFLIHQRLSALCQGRSLSFITLTLCGKGEPLHELITRLYKSFRALRSHPIFIDNVMGGAAFLEIKYSDKAQRWHPHLHIIADAKFIEQGWLAKAWHSITKDSFIVDIRRVNNPEEVQRYVTKYASKPLNTSFSNSPDLLEEAIMALKGRRLCTCFYSWYGTALSHAEDEELADDVIDAAGYTNFQPFGEFLEDGLSGQPEVWQIMQDLGREAQLRMLCTPPPN